MSEPMSEPWFPTFASEAAYEQGFDDPALGVRAARAVADRHGLVGEPARSPWGTNVVFRLGDAWLKFYPPFLRDEGVAESAALASLSGLTGRLGTQVPELLHAGELDAWSYAVLSHVPGVPFHEVRDRIGAADRVRIAAQLGGVLRELHDLPRTGIVRPTEGWPAFVAGRVRDALRLHAGTGTTEPWLARIETFLAERLPDLAAEPGDLLLHADLHHQHVLLREGARGWELAGIVDFADAVVGAAGYEFVDPALWLFRGDAVAQAALFEGYGLPASDPARGLRLMGWTLVHRFTRFPRWFAPEIGAGAGSLEELASSAFPVPFAAPERRRRAGGDDPAPGRA